jgi:hypothetical protein
MYSIYHPILRSSGHARPENYPEGLFRLHTKRTIVGHQKCPIRLTAIPMRGIHPQTLEMKGKYTT